MKKLLYSFFVVLASLFHLHAGESFLYPIVGPSQVQCCGMAQYSIDVKNINTTFAIQNINGRFIVTRQDQTILDETIYPREEDLQPNTTTTFVLEIPAELLVLDGLIEIFFEFNSDFDLNDDPTATFNTLVEGCGMTKEIVTDFFMDA